MSIEEQAADRLVAETHDYLARNLAPIVRRIKAVEDRAPERGEKGEPGKDGRDGTSVDLVALSGEISAAAIAAATKAVEAIPLPKDGRDFDGDFDAEILAAAVAKQVAAIPLPRNGTDGKDGAPGVDGRDGRDFDPEALDAAVAKHVALIPPPENGKDGAPGRDGAPGIDGKDADVEAITARVLENVSSVLDAIEVPKDGKDGAPGPAGEPGRDGKDADLQDIRAIVLDALPDLVAKVMQKAMAEARVDIRETLEKAIAAIPAPMRGEKGEEGARGRDGQEGTPGRDAMQIEVLSAIDESEVYRRGTWALHKGGLWRAFEKTAGMRGWECAVEGFAGAKIEYGDDVRSANIKLLGSSRVFDDVTVPLPSIIHRGVWKQQGYTPGDTVMKDGHLWIATGTPDAADEPGTSKMWQLMVRRGRDGRDDIRAAALSPVRLSQGTSS